MTPLISVIVPVYNVEEYLDRCVDSIVNQTYQNLEIILVDDGSTDNSGIKCDEWKMKDKRVVVVHKKNGGLSDARNAGLEIVNGEYIGFVDSDDFINADMYQVLFDMIQKTEADIAECKWVHFENEIEVQTIEMKTLNGYEVFSAEEALYELIKERKFKQTVVNKLYYRQAIKVTFPVGKTNEDDYWTYQVFGQSKRIALVDEVLYYYFQRSTSIMHVAYSPKRLDGVFARKERMEYIMMNYPRLTDVACLSYIWTCFYHYQVICRNAEIDMDHHYRKMLHSEYKEQYRRKAIQLQPPKQRVWMCLFKVMPNATCKIRNTLKIGL